MNEVSYERDAQHATLELVEHSGKRLFHEPPEQMRFNY